MTRTLFTGEALMQRFHAHLDECGHCRTRPFDLCAAGMELLREAVTTDIDRVRDRLGADARLGAVEADGQVHAPGYGHGV